MKKLPLVALVLLLGACTDPVEPEPYPPPVPYIWVDSIAA